MTHEVSFDERGSPSQCFLTWCKRTVTDSFTLGGGDSRYSCKQHKKKFLDGNPAVSFEDFARQPTTESEPIELPAIEEE